MPALPPELVDETIDHLWADPAALRACSLVCRAWRPSTRLHLFRTVRVRSAADCARLGALLAAAPAIAPCVRRLTLHAEYSGVDGAGVAQEDDGWVDAAAALLAKLDRVATLGLARVRWHALRPETRAALLALSASVRALFLFEVKFGAARDVVGFLSAFPVLAELYFHGVSWTEDASGAVEPPSTEREAATAPGAVGDGKSPLTYLFLDSRSSPTLVTEWLLSHPSEKRLRTIQLCWREVDHMKAVGDLLLASGAALERLQVEFPAGVPEEAVLQNHLSLASNTRLRCLHFGGLDVGASRAFLSNGLFPWVTAMLSQVRSRQLQEVTFELEITSVDDLLALDWVRIDRDLSQGEFTSLAVMFYVGCADGVQKEVKRIIAGGLSGFLEKGTLSILCI
ncbi:hypothetical protein B0H21DRAFT_776768 [Amylocystis lapponica]|nr:hypothetical protein B0H21DRAFT_776768 [Amylocystis lapponica]